MLVSPSPTWKQLLLPQKSIDNEYWKDSLWVSKSGVSIRLLVESYRRVFDKKNINVWIPEIFCAETEAEFMDAEINLIRYPMTKEFEPDWNKTKQLLKEDNLDVFIFVHYFGEAKDISKARVFCDKNNAMLIEDCAHVLYKYDKIGQKGDFVIFSPHKLLPIPDGAILQCNSKVDEKYNTMFTQIQETLLEPKSNVLSLGIWKIKKMIQKILRISKPVNYEYKVHYFEGEIEKEKRLSISKWAYNVVQKYSYEDLKTIAYIRRENLQILTYLLWQIEPAILPITKADIECPLFGVYSLENVNEPEEIIKKIQARGISVMYWPSLSKEVEKVDGIATQYSKDIFVIPIHQDISPQKLAQKATTKQVVYSDELSLYKIDNKVEEIVRWNKVLELSELSNITQDWYYGEVKKQAENWGVDRIIIQKNNVDIGVVQVLKKKILGITVAIRINKGPIFVSGENSIDNELKVVNSLRKKYYHHIPFLYVPFSSMTEENYVKMINEKWKNWDIFGFPTGVVDLCKTTEEIRAALDSKWRNQLKAAEKNEYVVHSDSKRFSEMMRLYESEQQDKGFVGVKTTLLECMNSMPNSPLRIFYIENDANEIIAYDIFYRHVNDATYYVGWNSNEGRKKYLNNLLLYHAAISLKAEGVRQLDLGGIEYIHTESIAKFKDGMRPTHFRQMGEFIKI